MLIADKSIILEKEPIPFKEYKGVTIARTGVQEYLESEIKEDGSPFKIVKVYRDADEVKKSVISMNGIPITENHPKDFLNYKSLRDKVIGVVSKAWFEDNQVKANLLFFSSPRYKEFSVGYSSKIIKYGDSYKQTEIKANHLANLANSRCGKICSIQLKDKGRKKMATIFINDKAIEVADEVKAYVDVLTANAKNIEEVAKKAFNDGRAKALDEIKLKETAKAFNIEVKDGANTLDVKKEIVAGLGIDTDGKSEEYLTAVIDTQMALKSTPASIEKQTKVNDGFDFEKYVVGGE